eukprot:scaffold41170_cov31-Prasinocladus_malaysianus.AAC.2
MLWVGKEITYMAEPAMNIYENVVALNWPILAAPPKPSLFSRGVTGAPDRDREAEDGGGCQAADPGSDGQAGGGRRREAHEPDDALRQVCDHPRRTDRREEAHDARGGRGGAQAGSHDGDRTAQGETNAVAKKGHLPIASNELLTS